MADADAACTTLVATTEGRRSGFIRIGLTSYGRVEGLQFMSSPRMSTSEPQSLNTRLSGLRPNGGG
jgi:hypothetical protein